MNAGLHGDIYPSVLAAIPHNIKLDVFIIFKVTFQM